MEKKEAFKKWGIPAAGIIVVLLGLWTYLTFFHATFGIENTVYLYIDTDDTPDSVRVKIKNTARPGISSGFPRAIRTKRLHREKRMLRRGTGR